MEERKREREKANRLESRQPLVTDTRGEEAGGREGLWCWLMHCREGEKRRKNKSRRREERVRSRTFCVHRKRTGAKRAAADWQPSRRAESESRQSSEEITAHRTPLREQTKTAVSNRFCHPKLQFGTKLQAGFV